LRRLITALYAVTDHARRFQSADPIDTASIRLLYGLRHAGPLRPSVLATLNMLDLSTVSRHCQALERAGFIERSPDPADGRASRVALTEAGDAALESVLANRVAALADVLHRWDPEDRRRLTELLRRLADDLSADAGCPALPTSDQLQESV
jgi:DNA-binding MarR family transcriptional regulator